MGFLVIFGLAVILVALAFAALAVKVILKKRGLFPNIHIGSNRQLRDKGIVCARTFDKMEQAKAWKDKSSDAPTLTDDSLNAGC